MLKSFVLRVYLVVAGFGKGRARVWVYEVPRYAYILAHDRVFFPFSHYISLSSFTLLRSFQFLSFQSRDEKRMAKESYHKFGQQKQKANSQT